MKRYRVMSIDFDSRPSILRLEIKDAWEEEVKKLHRANKEQVIQSLIDQYGVLRNDVKLGNFLDLGDKPFSIIAYHNKFLHQIRNAFVVGAYYPALAGACTLGERILNHLVLTLREDFRVTSEYKKVYTKKSFDDWNLAIGVLESWGILLPSVVKTYKAFEKDRHQAVHFNPEVDVNDRFLALEAIRKLQTIIGEQFSAFGPQPWFITNIPGEIFIKKEFEQTPFIKRVYLPSCYPVGPYFSLEYVNNQFVVHDEYQYEDREISDDEFVTLRIKYSHKKEVKYD